MIQILARSLLRILGWQVIGVRPSEKKYVLVAAPHTSNWDFLYGYLAMLAMGIDVHFAAKDSLFKAPLGIFTRALGGVPVIRDRRTNMVAQMIAIFENRDEFVLAVPPAGTRRGTDHWKSGFYYIALGAHVPIGLAIVDYKQKRVGIAHIFMPTGDLSADMTVIRPVYTEAVGKFPQNKSVVRLRQEDE